MKKLWLYLYLTGSSMKTSIMAAFEYRVVFFMQIIGMVINDMFFLILWSIFFTHFPEVRGWTQADNILLIAFSTTIYGIVLSVCGGWNFSRLISLGELDQYLTLPKSLLWQILVRKLEVSALGDVIFGLVIFGIWGDTSLVGITKFLGLSVLCAACVLNFIIIIQSLAFYFGHIEEAAEQIIYLMMGFSLYPQNQFYGLLKLIMLTIVPSFYISALPVALMRDFNWVFLATIVACWLITLIIAIVVFKKGLKRYESGNLIGVKI